MVAEDKKSRARKRGESKPEAPESTPEKWDDVAEASWESFPASDPPAFTMRRPARPEGKDEDKQGK